MKRIFIVVVILLAAGAMAYAQRAADPTREDMDKYLEQAKDHASEFESMFDDLKSRNNRSGDIATFNRLKSEIDSLESRINTESNNISATHDRGNRVSTEIMGNLERLINQHKAKVEELDKHLSK